MSFATLAAADLRYAIGAESGAFSARLVWGSQTVDGSIPYERESGRTLDDGDFLDCDAQWAGVLSDFTNRTPPPFQQTVEIFKKIAGAFEESGTKYFVSDSSKTVGAGGVLISLRRTT